MDKCKRKKYLLPAAACLLVIIGLTLYYFLSAISSRDTTQYVYIDSDDNIDSVYTKLCAISTRHGMSAFMTLSRHSQYPSHIREGRYEVSADISPFTLFRHMKNGMQAPVSLTIPSVRTMDKLAGVLSSKLMADSTAFLSALSNDTLLQRLGYDTLTVPALFIPNTYEVYWNISPEKLMERMKKENDHFWNAERKAKARQLGLTPTQVATLASIVDEETAVDKEKPMVAGMYYNRLNYRDAEYPEGMPLQADPTIKFALKNFDLKRIYHKMLFTASPYNTYKNVGLPPGPIRIPSVAGIDAVLNLKHHDYLYMCAKEDFSGTHNFSRTYEEHKRNAERYAKALNECGIN